MNIVDTLPSAPAIRAALVLDPDSGYWYDHRVFEPTDSVPWRETVTSRVERARDTIHTIAHEIDRATRLPELIDAVEELLLTAPFDMSQPIYALMREIVPPTVVVPTPVTRR